MNKRQIIISSIGGLIIIALAAMLSGKLADSATPPARKASRTLKTVSTQAVKNGPVQFELPIYGKLNAHDRIQLFSEVNGILLPTKKKFLEGVSYKKGERLLQIDNTEAMSNLMAQRSNYLNSITAVLPDLKIDYPTDYDHWLTYLENLDIDQAVPAPPHATGKKAELYLTSRGIYSSFYNLKSAEARLNKYDIHAPFNGVVTSSNIRQGTLIRPGQLLGEFISSGQFELETSLSIRFLPFIKVGSKVDLHSADIGGMWTGQIERINKKIDESTQTVKVYIAVNGSDLREGLYLEGTLRGLTIEDATALPRRLLLDNNHVFTVQNDSIMQKTEVQIVEYTETEAIVRGLVDGDPLVMEVVSGAFSGMVVRQNKTQATK
jgi:multidrug efflux pump subunit AcrA (membrane-fusion protein)